jgi:predicted nucleic acid-binding Zn ribbon protein
MIELWLKKKTSHLNDSRRTKEELEKERERERNKILFFFCVSDLS